MVQNKEKQNIPEGWVKVPFGKHIKLQGGNAFRASEYVGIGVPIVRIGNVGKGFFVADNFVYVSKEEYRNNESAHLKAGDILMGMTGELGKVAKIGRKYLPAALNQRVGRVVFKNEHVDREFTYHTFLSNEFKNKLEKYFIGAAQKNISSAQVEGTEVLLPPLKEQQKIAEVLGAVDEEMEKTKEVIEATERLKKGLMQKLFTRGIGHTKFKQTELGEIPESWDLKRLEDVAVFSNGKAHEKLINIDGKYIVVNSKYISSDGKVKKFTKTPLSLMEVGDVAMVMSDVPKGKALAKCLYVDENEKYTLNQRICSLRVKKILNSEFLFYVLNRNKYFIKHDDGVGQTNLRKNEVLNCPFQIPPITEQIKIVEIIKVVDKKILVNKKLLIKQTELKKGLMQDLLSGVKRVKV